MSLEKSKNQRLVIIDGHAIIHRAYHALPPLTAKDGTVVNAVFGFTSMLLKVMEDLKPTHLLVSFDVAGGTFRDQIYSEYKATRVKADQDLYDQIPLVYDVVRAFDIPIYEKKGFEADDVMGTIVSEQSLINSKEEMLVVTGDMDILQLVDDKSNVRVYELRKGLSDIVIFDEAGVREKYGFGPERIVDYKSLRGDTSDNIPGVRGIGDKTAKELIEKVGGLEQIYSELENSESEIRSKFTKSVIKKLEEGKELAYVSKELATIKRDVPGLNFNLSKTEIKSFDEKKVTDILKKFEFFSLLSRVPGFGKKEANQEDRKIKSSSNKKLVMVETANFAKFFKALGEAKQFVCKEVLFGSDVIFEKIKGFVFVVSGVPFYLALNKVTEKQKNEVLGIFNQPEKTLIGHDVKQLIKTLLANEIKINISLFDIMIASYVINASTRAHDLKSLVLRELGQELPSASDQGSLFGVEPSVVAGELIFIEELEQKFINDLKKIDNKDLFSKIEMRLIPVLAQMELNGMAIDEKLLGTLSKEVAEAIEKITKTIFKEAGEEFNVASSTQLRDILFEKMQLPTQGIKKGKTGYSTAASELEKLRGTNPIIEMIEEHRELAKLQSTYVDSLPKLVHPKTGRIHTSFNQAVAATGRLSSSDPNMQNIPIRTEMGRKIRNAFIAKPGYTLVAADYSQIELRIVASLAKDKKLIEIFNRGEDIHSATAAAINGVPLADVTKEMRYSAKEVNFGVLYGMGVFGLSWRANIPQWQAKEFIDKYFFEFAGVKEYLDSVIKSARKNGYAETLFGRRRHIPELQSSNFQMRAAGERMAINMPVQGTAADLMKLAMIAVQDRLNKDFSLDKVGLILQVHDELVLEVKNGLEEVVSEVIKSEMEKVVKLAVPVVVNVGQAKRWGELK